MWYGSVNAEFARYANLADAALFRIDSFPPWSNPAGYVRPWRNAAAHVDDGYRVSAPVGSLAPNPWGLHDMHGNVAEWALPDGGSGDRAVACGGSWYDPPSLATAAHRDRYAEWQRVFDVGFRVVCAAE